jgi:predicted amidophosphoribosyltransferase
VEIRHPSDATLTAMLDWLIPPLCVACRRCGETARGDPLCGPCRRALPWLGPRVCDRCALPRPCGPPCPARAQAFAFAWSPVAYAGPVPALVIALKDHGATALARLMAAQIAATAPPGLWAAATALVPVPADPLRRRSRGVDHAGWLARDLAPRIGVPVAAVLRRRRHGGRQAGRGRAERLRADPGEVSVRTPPEALPRVAILVDDVHTTGATLHACAVALLGGGARTVGAVTYARTLA